MAADEAATHGGHAVHLCLAAELVVGLAKDGLVEDVADALLLGHQAADIFVAGTQRHLVGDFKPCHDDVDALVVQLGETHPAVEHIEVTRVLHIVLIIGVVYNALNITFIVANHVAVFKDIFHIYVT